MGASNSKQTSFLQFPQVHVSDPVERQCEKDISAHSTPEERQCDSSGSSLLSSFAGSLRSMLTVPQATALCETAAAPPLPPPGAPGSSGETVATNDTKEAPPLPSAEREMEALATDYTNPGPYEMASMDAKRLVSLDTNEGFRCDIQKQLSPFMLGLHSFHLGTNSSPDGRKSSYTFLTQVVTDEAGGLLMAQLDPGRGSVNGRVHVPLLGGMALAKLQMNLTGDGQGDQAVAELDFGGMTWTGNLKYGTMGGSPIYGGNFFQAVTPRVAIGGEGMFVGANQSVVSSYTLKFSLPAKTGDEDTSISAAASSKPSSPSGPPGSPLAETTGSSTMIVNFNPSQQALTMNYKRVVTPNRVALGAELQVNPFTLDSNLLLGGEFKLHRSRFAVCVDGGLRTQALLEAKLGMAQGSPTLNFSADVDHLKDDMKFGFGLNIEG